MCRKYQAFFYVFHVILGYLCSFFMKSIDRFYEFKRYFYYKNCSGQECAGPDSGWVRAWLSGREMGN